MLWDLIRDFFVEKIFGGLTSTGDVYGGTIGKIALIDANGEIIDEEANFTASHLMVPIGNVTSDDYWNNVKIGYISFGDWLSTTATAISITIIVVLCCLFIYKIIKLIGGLIR